MGLVVSESTKTYGEKIAVNKINFTFDKPGVFGLLGTNGAGKTTTIRMILGIIDKNSGEIMWNNKPVKRENVNFGYLPEERGLYPKSKVSEQLIYFGKLKGMNAKDAKKSLSYWLERLKATEYYNSVPEQLSKGNQQKIQLVTALIHDPELLILDEPFSGLDPINTDIFKSVVYELVEKNKYIIMSSHQMSTVEEYCKEILILDKGNTVLKGNLREIKSSYGRNNLSIQCEDNILDMAKDLNIGLKEKTPFGYEFKIQNDQQAYLLLGKMLEASIKLDKFEIREPSLHEIFIEKVGAAK